MDQIHQCSDLLKIGAVYRIGFVDIPMAIPGQKQINIIQARFIELCDMGFKVNRFGFSVIEWRLI